MRASERRAAIVTMVIVVEHYLPSLFTTTLTTRCHQHMRRTHAAGCGFCFFAKQFAELLALLRVKHHVWTWDSQLIKTKESR
jgi:hypothetical protein